MHFEDLWESCENLNKNDDTLSKIKELNSKIKLFEFIALKKNEMIEQDYNTAIGSAFGEILFTLTKISLKENINVFKQLKKSFEQNK